MLIRLENVSKHYLLGRKGIKQEVLKGIDLIIPEGETIAVTGPSGSGKTTLLNLIGTLDNPDSGGIFFRDSSLVTMNESQKARFRNEHIGFVFQRHDLLPQLNILENVMLPVLPYRQKSKENYADYAHYLIERVGLSLHASKKPSELSVGECQRTAIARALINKPAILLADEPTGALDRDNALMLGTLFVELCRELNMTALVVTHSAELAGMMEKIYSLSSGKIICQ